MTEFCCFTSASVLACIQLYFELTLALKLNLWADAVNNSCRQLKIGQYSGNSAIGLPYHTRLSESTSTSLNISHDWPLEQ